VALKTTAPRILESRLETLGDTLRDACPEVEFAYLFGSAAKGQIKPLSDIDIAVFLEPAADQFNSKLRVLAAASKHLATDRLDIVVLNTAPLSLAGRIVAGRRVILERKPFARQSYEALVIRQFADFRLFERRHFAKRERRG